MPTNPTHKDEVNLLRPIIGIENRTAQEVFDIMCDRIKHGPAALAHTVPDALREALDELIRVGCNSQFDDAEMRAALREAMDVRTGPLREGFVAVPVEPTEAMLKAGRPAHDDYLSAKGPYPRTRAVWSAMLAARPTGES